MKMAKLTPVPCTSIILEDCWRQYDQQICQCGGAHWALLAFNLGLAIPVGLICAKMKLLGKVLYILFISSCLHWILICYIYCLRMERMNQSHEMQPATQAIHSFPYTASRLFHVSASHNNFRSFGFPDIGHMRYQPLYLLPILLIVSFPIAFGLGPEDDSSYSTFTSATKHIASIV